MSLPPRFTSELRDRIAVSEIVGRKVKLTRAGREFKACCPFHQEKTPSFYVNDDKQFYHCFGCGASGDVIDFVMRHDNLSFIEAVETLAAQAGMEVPRARPEDIKREQEQKNLYSLIDEASRFFESHLHGPAGRPALDYLRGRGVSAEAISAFRLGFAPADFQVLRAHLAGKGYKDAQMIEAGLVRASDRGGAPYSFFRERIMFPVADRRGRIVAFGGRILPGTDNEKDKGPKYINSSDTPLFHKGRMLYGESRARRAAADKHDIIVVEGYLDVIACVQAGFRGAVAPLGTALTEEQILALWKMIPGDQKIPVLCFDGDNAGRRAAARAAERLLPLLKPDHSAAFAFLPEGQDPDSLIRASGATALQAALEAALPLIDVIWNTHAAGRPLATPEDRAGFEKSLNDDIARIADRSVQHYYRQTIRARLYQNFGRGKKTAAAAAPALKPRRPGFRDESRLYRIVLAAALNHHNILSNIEDDLARLPFPDGDYDRLRQEILDILAHHNEPLDRAGLFSMLASRGLQGVIDTVLGPDIYVHAAFAAPGASPDKVREDWNDFIATLDDRTEDGEAAQSWQHLKTTFSPDDERRALALTGARRTSKT